MKIDEQQLRELLGNAYEAGWHGCKELRDTAVEEIITDFNQRLPEPKHVHGWKMGSLNDPPQMATLEIGDFGLRIGPWGVDGKNHSGTTFGNYSYDSGSSYSWGIDGTVIDEEVVVV